MSGRVKRRPELPEGAEPERERPDLPAAPAPPSPADDAPAPEQVATWRIVRVLRGEEHVFEATINRQGLIAGAFEAPGGPVVVLDATSLRFLSQALKPACAHVPFLRRKAASGSVARHPEFAEWRHLRSTAGLEYELAADLEDPADPGFVFTDPDGLELALTLDGALFLRAALEAATADEVAMRAAASAPAALEAPRVRIGALKRARAGERWNDVEDARLRQAWEDGLDANEIAARFERTKGAIVSRLVRLGICKEHMARRSRSG